MDTRFPGATLDLPGTGGATLDLTRTGGATLAHRYQPPSLSRRRFGPAGAERMLAVRP